MSGDADKDLLKSKDFPPLINDAIIRVAKGQEAQRRPVWIMRQAGRYLPEFQALRAKHSFFEICQTPALACEVTLMPIKRFDLDAAIIFSDILVIPQALGMVVEMRAGVGPVLPKPLTVDTIDDLNQEGAIDRLKYVGEAITLTRHKLEGKVPLFGFSGGPWTLMCYMVEGGSSKTMAKARKWLYAHPEETDKVLNLLTDTIVEYLVMQVEAGAQILQVFETCAEFLNKHTFHRYCIPHLRRIRKTVQSKLGDAYVPMVLFAKGAWFSLDEQCDLNYEVVGVDWNIQPEVAVALLPNTAVQGNLDPCALYAEEEEMRSIVRTMLHQFKDCRHIVNLGHGILPDTDVDAVEAFIDEVHKE